MDNCANVSKSCNFDYFDEFECCGCEDYFSCKISEMKKPFLFFRLDNGVYITPNGRFVEREASQKFYFS